MVTMGAAQWPRGAHDVRLSFLMPGVELCARYDFATRASITECDARSALLDNGNHSMLSAL